MCQSWKRPDCLPDPADRLPDAVGFIQAIRLVIAPSRTMKNAAATTAAAALAIGQIDALASRLATADAAVKKAEKESARLRGEISELMQDSGIKSHRTAWALMTLSDAVTYTYSDKVTVLDVQLKGQREIERKTGVAEIATSKKSLKVTYSK